MSDRESRSTRLGLGLAAVGRPGYINLDHARDLGGVYDPAAMEAHAHSVLDAAYDGGVRYFDAARSYGRAEDFVASWLAARGVVSGDVRVGSKWGYTYTADWRVDAATHEVKDHSLAALRRQVAESRARLGRYLVLYQIHSATPDSPVLADAAVIDELASLRAQGLAIGLTTSGPGQRDVILNALDIRRGGERVFDSVQATWNLLERAAEPALREAHDAGVRVIVKEALANGRLTARNVSDSLERRLGPLRMEAEGLGSSVDAVALAAVLAEPWADVVLSGAATAAHMRSNLHALDVVWTGETAARLGALVMDSRAYWQERRELRWN